MVGVAVGVLVGVSVGVFVGVLVGVAVGVFVAADANHLVLFPESTELEGLRSADCTFILS